MTPLRVAVFIRIAPQNILRDNRREGPWSYAVPEFTWEFKGAGEGTRVDRGRFRDFDIIVNGESCWPDWVGEGPPVVGWFWDTTWTESHFKRRFDQGGKCDLLLIDHDILSRFKKCGDQFGRKVPVKRMLYCVNDKVFFDQGLGKTVDIADHQIAKHSETRKQLREHLIAFSGQNGLTMSSGTIQDIVEYAKAFNRAKVSVNLSQSATNRPHRVFDAMAAKTCLLNGPCPTLDEEGRVNGVHFMSFADIEEAGPTALSLIRSGEYLEIAQAGHDLIMTRHTWRIRAAELRDLINKELGI